MCKREGDWQERDGGTACHPTAYQRSSAVVGEFYRVVVSEGRDSVSTFCVVWAADTGTSQTGVWCVGRAAVRSQK